MLQARTISSSALLDVLTPTMVIGAMMLATILAGWPTPDFGSWPDHPDRAIWMDAAWRVSRGQLPHVDFVTPIGAAWLYINALPVTLFGPEYKNLPYGVAIIMGLAAAVIWHIVRPVAGRLYALLALLYVHKLFFQSQFLDYNELALFLLLVVVLVAAIPGEVQRVWNGVYAGASLALLLFWKINFFIAAIAIITLSIVLYSRQRNWYLTFATTFIVIALLLSWSFDWRIGEMLAQYQIPADIKGKHAIKEALSAKSHANVTAHFFGYVVLSAIVFWIGRIYMPSSRLMRLQPSVMVALLFLGMLGLQNALCLTNASLWAPHMVPWTVLVAGLWKGTSARISVPSIQNSVAIGRVMIYISIVLILMAWGNTVIPKLWRMPDTMSARTMPLDLSDMTYQVSVADGLALIRKNSLTGQRIATLAYANPFPALTQSYPPRYMPLWWSIYDSVNIKAPPRAESVFSDASVLMQPKWHLNGFMETQADYIKTTYGNYIHQHYRVFDEDAYWVVWVRTQI